MSVVLAAIFVTSTFTSLSFAPSSLAPIVGSCFLGFTCVRRGPTLLGRCSSRESFLGASQLERYHRPQPERAHRRRRHRHHHHRHRYMIRNTMIRKLRNDSNNSNHTTTTTTVMTTKTVRSKMQSQCHHNHSNKPRNISHQHFIHGNSNKHNRQRDS
jgi:hypothetical protein